MLRNEVKILASWIAQQFRVGLCVAVCLGFHSCDSFVKIKFAKSSRVAASEIIKDTVSTPIFSVPGGSYVTAQIVKITSATSDAKIYYTIDGSTPTTSSEVYGGPISVSYSQTIKAIATKSGFVDSVEAIAEFTIGYTILATLGTMPAGVTSLNFHKLTGAASTYCSPGFTYCNPNMNVTNDAVIVTLDQGQTYTVGSGLSTDDMYFFVPINPVGYICNTELGMPNLYDFVLGSISLSVSCHLDPPEISGLTATTASGTQVDLSWTSGEGTTIGFRIAYKLGSVPPADCVTPAGGVTLISEWDIVNTSKSVSGLSPYTSYSFRVCAINSDLPQRESPGLTTSASTALKGTVTARGKHIQASWVGGVGPYTASLYSDASCTLVMKSTGATDDTVAMFAEQAVPGSYYFKVLDQNANETSCAHIALTAPSSEDLNNYLLSSYNTIEINMPTSFPLTIWQFEWAGCSKSAGRKLSSFSTDGVISLQPPFMGGLGSLQSFIISADNAERFSPCIEPSPVISQFVERAQFFDKSAVIIVSDDTSSPQGPVTLALSLHAAADTSCQGSALFSSSGLSSGDTVLLSDSTLQPGSNYYVKVSRSASGLSDASTCHEARTKHWVKSFSLAASQIVPNNVDLTWTGASAGIFTLMRTVNSCAGPATVLYSGVSSATFTDSTVLPGTTYYYRVTGGSATSFTEISNCVEVIIPGA